MLSVKSNVWMILAAIAWFAAVPVNAQVIATYDFEDGTTQGWTSFNGASTPTNSTAAASSGTHSLLTTTGSSGQGGPSISVTALLLPGAQYTITGHVSLTSGESASNANFTMRRTDPSCSGGTCFDTVGSFQVAVSSSGFAQIGGSYTVSTTETALTLYAQLVGASTAQSFYLDDVVITETAPPPSGSTVATYTFQDGGLDGWFPFGSPTLTNAAPPFLDPQGNTRSLLVTNRTATFMGPAINLLGVSNIVAGATYKVTAYVLLATPDSSNPTATITTDLTNCANTSGRFTNIMTSAALSTSDWTPMQGTFSFSNVPAPPTTLTLYFQSSSATDSFYISDVVISQIAPPPPDPATQDNTGITTTFEDGALDGWSSRAGATLANSTAAAHGGTHSLLVTGRTAFYDGPQISVTNKMYNGSQYAISVWVQMLQADGQNHTINLSLQITLSGNTSFPGITAVTVPGDGQWHQINVPQYSMSNAYDTGGQGAFLYLQTATRDQTPLASFYVDDLQLTYLAPPVIQSSIPSLYKTLSYYFPLGAEIDNTDLSGPHAQLLTTHFNSIVSGNDMKWSSVENTKGTFTYTAADNQVGFAQCNNMLVRGHNLVWATGAQTPSYAVGDGTNSPANQATVTANIQEHIQNEVTHFGNKVYVWDVVNEPLDPNQPDCLVHGPFYQVLGKSYIDIALQAARQFAPAGTKLFINDYSTADPNRLACLISVVQDLRSRGIPIDGVGHEMHNNINYPSTAAMVNAVNTVAASIPNIDQQLTEVDESVYTTSQNANSTACSASNYNVTNAGVVPPSILAEQGWLFAQYFNALRQLQGKLSGITFWGMADDDTWLSTFPCNHLDEPLPFNSALQAKPAYWGIVDPTQLPGYGLTFAVTSKTGPAGGSRTWTVTANNPSSGPAYGTQITGFTLKQISGAACTPVVTPPSSFPVSLGDIAAGGSSNTQFTINFTGCPNTARFSLSMPWSSAVYNTGTLVSSNQFQ